MKKAMIVVGAVLVFASPGNGAARGQFEAFAEIRKAEDLQILLGEKATDVEKKAGSLFCDRVKERTGLECSPGKKDSAKCTMLVGTKESSPDTNDYSMQDGEIAMLGEDGFHLGASEKTFCVVGQNPLGVMAGIGKLLRQCIFGQGRLMLPEVRMTLAPESPVRGMYYWTISSERRIGERADPYTAMEDVGVIDRMIEDLALWGCNSLMLWVDSYAVGRTRLSDTEDPGHAKAMAFLNRMKHLGETAMSVGMSRDLLIIAAFSHGPNCPSTPEGQAALRERWEWLFDFFPGAKYVWCWGHDPGGHDCEKCGGSINAFYRAGELMARVYHEHVPDDRLLFSTWGTSGWDLGWRIEEKK